MISFFGVRTDRHGFRILIWKHVSTQKISTQNSKLAVDPYMPPRRSGMPNNNNNFEIASHTCEVLTENFRDVAIYC